MKTVAKWNTLYRDNKGEKMTESHIKLKALFEEYVNENEKFKEGAGVKASATRARKALMEISKLCKTRRGEIKEAKNNA